MAWTRTLALSYLFASAAATAIAAALLLLPRRAGESRRGRLTILAALALLAGGIGASAWTHVRLATAMSDWDRFAAAREIRLQAALDTRMDALFRRGSATARRAAAAAGSADGAALFSRLAAIRGEAAVAAVAVFDAEGELTAWSGEHRGILPQPVRAGSRPVLYAERPLFSYLYFSSPVSDSGGAAVAIVLLQMGPPLGPGRAGGFAAAFRAETGAALRFAAGAEPDADWRYPRDGPARFSATIEPLTQAATRARVATAGRRLALSLFAAAFILLVAAWIRRGRIGRGRFAAPLFATALLLAIAPLDAVLPVSALFSPGVFLLRLPTGLTLGPLLAVLIPIAALLALWRAPPVRRGPFGAWIVAGTVLVPVGFAAAMRLLLVSAGPTLLEGSATLWWALQTTAVLLLGSLAALAFPRARETEHDAAATTTPRWQLIVAGAALSILAAILVLVRWYSLEPPPVQPGELPLRNAALWAAPFVLMAVGLGRRHAAGGRLVRTLCAGLLATTFVLPNLWAAQVGAKLGVAERSLSTLGSRSDPFVAYLLTRFGSDLRRRSARGEAGVDLLFRSWVESGLAEDGYPLQLVLWDSTLSPVNALHLAGASEPALKDAPLRATLTGMLRRARESGRQVLDAEPPIPGANQALAVPLSDGWAATAVVAPRRVLEFAPALLGFLGARAPSDIRLTLIEAPGLPPTSTGVEWTRIERGWRSEVQIRFPEGLYHAHLDIRIPPLMIEIARGTLLGAFDLSVLVLLWTLGRAAEGGWRRPAGGWLGWLGGFRARITLALFAFFLLPTLAFGTFAYRALAGEAIRSASLLSQRSVEQAAEQFPSLSDLGVLSDRIGEEVLRYFRGELAQSSSAEAVQLGLYGAWMPPAVYLALRSGEEVGETRVLRVSDTPYVMSFRALRPAGTIAVPVSLSTGDAIARQRELTHLVLFAVLVGGLLSLALSLLVARTLSRPIGQLRRGAAAVGAGRLDVRLPEGRTDEFGNLFASFNRMVRRLRRARSREIRTARILAWGEMARQVAHEIKNPLTPIKLSVQHLRRAYADRRADFGEILDTNVEHVLAEIDRLGEIARAFSRYGLPAESTGPLEPVDVTAVVRETLALYRAGDTGVEYRQDVEPDLPGVQARAAELKEVLVNLLENARAAIDRDGTVTVSAASIDGAVELRVRDDGSGISADLLPRIFEPHFSTRTAGTGLGLAIVRRLVEAWGGRIEAESEAGVGTTMRIVIPVA